MTAIQKMVKYLDKQYTAPNQHGVVARIIDYARRLAAEEAKDKKCDNCGDTGFITAVDITGMKYDEECPACWNKKQAKEKPTENCEICGDSSCGLSGKPDNMVVKGCKCFKPSAPACGACIPLKKECENCERMRPSAPASLVEELTDWCNKILDGDQEIYGQSRLAARWITEEILPRYRPTPTEDIVLWEGLVKTGEPGLNLFRGHGEYESTVLFSVDYAKLKGQKGQLIFRKYEEGK